MPVPDPCDHVREPSPRQPRSRLLRRCLLIGLSATLLGGLPAWDPNPSEDVEIVQRGIPFGWIRTCEPHGLEIRIGSVPVPMPQRDEDEPIGANGYARFPVVFEPVRLLVDVAFWSVLALAALTRPRRVLRSLLAGLGITAALAAIPHEFCADGNAYGFPFAIVHPHGSSMPALGIQLPVSLMQEWVFDLLNLARNWLVWTALAFGGAAMRRRWRGGMRWRRARGTEKKESARVKSIIAILVITLTCSQPTSARTEASPPSSGRAAERWGRHVALRGHLPAGDFFRDVGDGNRYTYTGRILNWQCVTRSG